MTQTDIIDAAVAAGFDPLSPTLFNVQIDSFERFAALVAAKEREACARTAERHFRELRDIAGDDLPAAIRARGNP